MTMTPAVCNGNDANPTQGDGNDHDRGIDTTSRRQTFIQVCARVRPLLVTSTGEKFFDSPKRGGAGRTSRLKAPVSSRLRTPTRIKGPATPPRKVKASNSALDDSDTGNVIIGWNILNESTIQQSEESNPIPGRTTSYTLDSVFSPLCSTKSLYDGSVRNVVKAAIEGYHASVFAYGQTSTGKTFTMSGTKDKPGVVPLAVTDAFRYIENLNSPREYLLRVSYMEIYNEQIVDLLAPVVADKSNNSRSLGPHQQAIRIFESPTEGVVIRGLREEVVTSPQQVFDLISLGEQQRQVGSTNMNTHSSRSHCIFRLLIESRDPSPLGGRNSNISATDGTSTKSTKGGGVRFSSLSLVDLAGSESAKLTGSTGERRKEGQYINKSLMALGQVIYKLSEWSKSNNNDNKTSNGPVQAPKHIPYRDSKLTRLLQPSLSGNAQIVIICNVSPQVSHLEESHNTLKFALRAKKIKQHAEINEVVDEKTLIHSYREEIEDLRQQLNEAREANLALQKQQQQTIATSSAIQPYDNEETRELIEAIQKMETLILKTAGNSPRNTPKVTNANNDVKNFDSLLESPLVTYNGNDGEDSIDDETDKSVLDTSILEDEMNQPTNSESENDGGDDEHIVTELHRIQGLLGRVLQRKGARTPAANPFSNDNTENGTGKVNDMYNTPNRVRPQPERRQIIPHNSYTTPRHNRRNQRQAEQEVEQLRLTTSLRKADSNFLQSQLAEKDLLLQECSTLLDALEKRQIELEAENAKLKEELRLKQ